MTRRLNERKLWTARGSTDRFSSEGQAIEPPRRSKSFSFRYNAASISGKDRSASAPRRTGLKVSGERERKTKLKTYRIKAGDCFYP